MTQESTDRHDPRIAAAVDEFMALIKSRYADASFDVSTGDDPEGVYVTATVDIDDPDEVTDLVIDRTLQLQIGEHLPVYMVPIRPISRVIDDRRRRLETGVRLPSAL
jgi:hypothetical protein